MGSASGCGPARGERSLPGDGPRAEPGSEPDASPTATQSETRTSGGRRAGLRGSAEISRILREGSPFRSRRVVVYVAPGAGKSRAAFVAGRKIGPAVARNRARRLLRAAWPSVAPKVRAGFDVVIVARPEIRGAKTRDVVEEIAVALAGAGVMSG
jgi:ribonuclease P protein component